MSLSEETQPNTPQPTQPISSISGAVEAKPHERRRHRSRSSRWMRRLKKVARIKWGRVLLVVVTALVVLAVGGTALVADTLNRVQGSLQSLSRVVDTLQSRPNVELTLNDFNRLQSSVDELNSSLGAAESRLRLVSPLRALNADLEGTLQVVDAAHSLTLAADDMLTALQPTLFFLVAGDDDETVTTQISSGERLVELLGLGRGLLINAQAHLADAQASIDTFNLGSLSPSLLLNAEGLRQYHSQLNDANTILTQAPDLLNAALGLSGERSYLILSQNSDELRPSGGYISTYGWMTVRNGRIIAYDYSPTTATSPNPPPARLADQIEVPTWWIQYDQPIYAAWDGSWFVDFPSTASMAMWYYNQGNNLPGPIDGVISIDIYGFETILAALGQVVVPEYNQVVSVENFREVVYTIRADQGDDLNHKQFVAALYRQIFEDWQSASANPDTSATLLGSLLEAVRQKHLMLYFADENLNQVIDQLGWSGAQIDATDLDYLLVADANLGNKSNRSIRRQLTYDVEITLDGLLNSRATIAYDYSARAAATDPAVNPPFHGQADYDNLLQVIVPAGSTLLGTDNLPIDPDVVTATTYTAFINRLTVAFDTSERYQYSYQTPGLIEDFGPYKRYRLLVQKQPGTPGEGINVQVTLPADAQTISVSPEPAASYNLDRPIIEFLLNLQSDQWVEVIYQAG